MTKQELIASAKNQAISDKQVFENLKTYTAQYDNISIFTEKDRIECEEVSVTLERLRPQVMEMFRLFVVEQHKDCCCGPE